MRVSGVTIIAFAAVLLTGCGGAISACSKAAIKAGSTTAAKTTATKGAAVGAAAGHAAPEGFAAATGAAAERQAARASSLSDDAGRAAAADDAGRSVNETDETTANEVVREVGQEALEKIPDVFNDRGSNGADDDRDRR